MIELLDIMNREEWLHQENQLVEIFHHDVEDFQTTKLNVGTYKTCKFI